MVHKLAHSTQRTIRYPGDLLFADRLHTHQLSSNKITQGWATLEDVAQATFKLPLYIMSQSIDHLTWILCQPHHASPGSLMLIARRTQDTQALS